MRILVALDDSENALRAVEFVSKNFSPEHEVTLFSVFLDTAVICEYDSPELIPYFLSEQKSFCDLEEKRRNIFKRSQERAKNLLLGAGFQEKNITIKSQPRSRGVARDVIDEALSGYNLIVMGRRGLSSISEFFLGSVSQKVLHACKDNTVLLVT